MDDIILPPPSKFPLPKLENCQKNLELFSSLVRSRKYFVKFITDSVEHLID